ncbi:type II toxin-antitoxin system ParD family antitoxin [Methylobacterium sp. J-001]|jgi:antitoxin ParD1/3/4|uniref:ribbon-helix-helix domain-containing protein n=1 Tax=Methylobacterium sp. J-001 TaxID=2836609 RepID=UPI001FBB98DC|nr:type II toxin-antitoxin system ParD family antitoxin [Methylobacterium sp. J-001]MCJ2118876.1 type II toxin-antitoxin system ParD family antitoxin [Methylobacterium sp. J-001]
MPPAETISVTLAPDTLRTVRQSVESGEYASVEAMLDEAVHALQRQRRENAERLDVIRARIRRSLDDPRPDLSSEEVQEHLDELFAEAQRDPRRA